MFDMNQAQSLLETQNKKLASQKEAIKNYLGTLKNTTFSKQFTEKDIDMLAAVNVMNQELDFKQSIIEECCCTERTYYLALRKYCIKLKLESSMDEYSSIQRQTIVEQDCKDNPEHRNILIEIIKSDLK